MPSFRAHRPASISTNIRAMLGSSAELSPLDELAVEGRLAETAHKSALAEKVRAEIAATQEAERARRDPGLANEYGAIASGLTVPQGSALSRHIRGEMVENPTAVDDTGEPMPNMPAVRPLDVTPQAERAYRSALASTLANRLATGKTNADQMTQAGGNLLTQATRAAMQDPALSIPDANRLAVSINQKTREPFSGGVNAAGLTANQETGEVNVASPQLHGATVAAVNALGNQRQARAGGAGGRGGGGAGGAPGAGLAAAAQARWGVKWNQLPTAIRTQLIENASSGMDIEENLASIRDPQADRREQKDLADLERKVTRFSGEIEKTGIPKFEAALQKIEAELAKYTVADPNTGRVIFKKDAPGVGQTGVLPQFMLSQAGKELRQALAPLKNIELKDRSGAAVTDQEMRRYLEELGGTFSDDQQILRAVANIRNRFDATKQNIVAGVTDDVLEEYGARGGIPFKRGGPLVPAGGPKPIDRRREPRTNPTREVNF